MTTENSISTWQESLSSLPDKQFFNIMRLYLGEIETPYNKQKLISRLASFLKTPENLSTLTAYLDEDELKILAAIRFIPNATKETLADFFTGTFSLAVIYSKVINLSERLIIYSKKDKFSDNEFLYLNPLLFETLESFLSYKYLLPDAEVKEFLTEDIFTISSDFLAAFISYMKIHGISCKSDGIIKKNDMNRLEQIFPGRTKLIQYLMTSFINLNLVIEKEKGFEIDFSRLNFFADLEPLYQYCFLCAASVSRFSREGLKKEAQLLIDCLSSIPEHGFTRETILHLAFLVGTYTDDGNAVAKKSRFTEILEQSRISNNTSPEQNADILDRMIDSAIEFGLLQNIGKDENKKDVYIFKASSFEKNSTHTDPKVVNIDSTFTVTIMPGLELKKLLKLISFMMIKKFGIVCEYEVSKQSVSAGFDNDWIPQSIFEEIEKYTYYELPQNFKINISEWYNSYNSSILYHGFILKVSKANIQFTENNPNINKYIKEKLADGIYLLNIPPAADISSFVDESGLEFLGNVKSFVPKVENSVLPLLKPGKKVSINSTADSICEKKNINDSYKMINALLEKLKSKNYEQNIKESLEHRILNKLILSEEQLTKAAVRTEIFEAGGMDFSGKIHLLDAALKEEDMIEMEFPTADGKGGTFTIIGKPLYLTKEIGEAIVRFQIEPSKDIENILVSRISHLRRLRF